MVKKHFLISLIVTFLLLSGCGLNGKNNIDNLNKNNKDSISVEDSLGGHKKHLTIEEIINNYIPKPYNPP